MIQRESVKERKSINNRIIVTGRFKYFYCKCMRGTNDCLVIDRNEDINCAIEDKLLETSTASKQNTTINIDQASASNIALGLERINNWMNLENNVRLKDNCNG